MIIAIVFSNTTLIMPQAEDDYGTGLNADTTADFPTLEKLFSPQKGNAWLKPPAAPYNEIFEEDKYVVSWQSENELSQKITARCNVLFHPRMTQDGTFGACGYTYGLLLQSYYTKVYYTSADGKVKDKLVIDTRYNTYDRDYVVITKPFYQDFINGLGHYFPNSQGNMLSVGTAGIKKCTSGNWPALEGKWWPVVTNEEAAQDKWWKVETETLQFKMKGPKAGKLTIKYICWRAERENTDDFWGSLHCDACRWHLGTALMGEDECYLASGEGSIDILSSNSVGSAGEENVVHTNGTTSETYTKYVYEEGQTIKISVDTGYSGTSLDPDDEKYGKGWRLKIYDSKGQLRDEMPLADDLRGYIYEYTLPNDAFVMHGENEWRVVLSNTMFDQAETRLFVVKDLESIPYKPTINSYDEDGNPKTKFTQGETVILRMEANANSKGTGDIDHFWVVVKYRSLDSTNYAVRQTNIPATRKAGSTYTASVEFQLSSNPNDWGNLYYRIHAVDSWGQKGIEGTGTIYAEKLVGSYRVTVLTTTGGSFIGNVDVKFKRTDDYEYDFTVGSSGRETIGLDYGTYTLTATKGGFQDFSTTVKIQDDTVITIDMIPGYGPPADIWLIVIVIIIACVGFGVYFLQKKGKINIGKYFNFRRK